MTKRRRSRATSISANTPLTSFYDILSNEVGINYVHHDPIKKEAIQSEVNFDELYENIINFIKVPFFVEKFMGFGLLYCFNDFLKPFTITPLKIGVFSFHLARFGKKDLKKSLLLGYGPLLQIGLFISTLYCLSQLDTSKLYHDIRRQSAIKLYVMIGVLEVVDKLLSTVGEDLVKFIFNLQFGKLRPRKIGIFTVSFVLCLVYLVLHSICLIYQTISLNVATNSYLNALFTLLLLSQFSEIKSTVFKKFDREGLFQNTCLDLTERFQMLIFLFLIGLRNLIETDLNQGLIPKFWKNVDLFGSISVFLSPTILVVGLELLVDWLKHSYIVKYNHFNPKIYERFLNVLSNDFLYLNHKDSGVLNLEENVFREINSNRNLSFRIGVPMMVLNVVVLKMAWLPIKYFLYGRNGIVNCIILTFLIFIILVTVKLILSLVLLKISFRRRNRFLLVWRKKQEEKIKKEPLEDDVLADILSNDYRPGNFSTVGPGSLEKNDIKYLYDEPEKRQSIDQYRVKNDARNLRNRADSIGNEGGLDKVVRYQMSSKRIW